MKILIVVLTLFLGIGVNSSCKKSSKIVKPIIVPTPPDNGGTITNPTYRIFNVGSGSGQLSIDGNVMGLKSEDVVIIKGGSYTGIEIKNISANGGVPVLIKNDGLVELAGGGRQLRISNVQNVVVSGNGTPTLSKGFSFSNNNNRAVQLDGTIDNFTFQFAAFRNISDYLIHFNATKVYNGNENSYSKNLKFLNVDCDNTASFLIIPGSVNSSGITGLINNLEIANLTFINAPTVASVVNIGAVEDFDVHHNTIKNINSQNNNHNGIFQLNGNGKFYSNLIRDHQGNAVRSWLFSVGSKTKDVLIYNNIVFNSRKYSAFEVQAFTNLVVNGQTTFANAQIFNNTCGSLNLSKDFVGVVVDVYNLLGGRCEVYNNLAFNFPAPSVNNIWSIQSSVPAIANNNLYFATSSLAGIKDETSFELLAGSAAKGTALTSKTTLITDYYGKTRKTDYSIGAVE